MIREVGSRQEIVAVGGVMFRGDIVRLSQGAGEIVVAVVDDFAGEGDDDDVTGSDLDDGGDVVAGLVFFYEDAVAEIGRSDGSIRRSGRPRCGLGRGASGLSPPNRRRTASIRSASSDTSFSCLDLTERASEPQRCPGGNQPRERNDLLSVPPQRCPGGRHLEPKRGDRMLPPVDKAVLVPVKDFAAAKVRLSAALDAEQRAALARKMATIVLRAAHPLPVFVVCDDLEVAAWAVGEGAQVLWRPGLGLNGAVSNGIDALAHLGIDRVIVAHSDLPLATSLAWVADFDGVTIVPDRHDDGTNVLSIATDWGFSLTYGPNSFFRHCAEAERLGLDVRVERDRALGWDVDVPDDLMVDGWISLANPHWSA